MYGRSLYLYLHFVCLMALFETARPQNRGEAANKKMAPSVPMHWYINVTWPPLDTLWNKKYFLSLNLVMKSNY